MKAVESQAELRVGENAAEKNPQLRRYNLGDWPAVLAAARAEGAEVVAPTHVIEQGGKVVGYGSVGRLAMIQGWISKAVPEPATFATLRVLENAAQMNGADVLVMACTDDCTVRPLLARAGYTEGAAVKVYYKKVS